MSDDPIRRLIDKQAITEALYLYARGWDRRDPTLLHAAFHPDATTAFDGETGPSHALLDAWLAALAPVPAMTHMIGNILIAIDPADADAALCESIFAAHHRRPARDAAPASDWFVKGRYLDRFERRDDGVWRIAHRIQMADLDHVLPGHATIGDTADDAAVRAFYAAFTSQNSSS